MLNALLYAPEYRPNMSSMIRSAEFYGLKTIYIYDRNNLLSPPNNKTSRADMQHLARVWTAGAINHIDIEIVENPIEFFKDYQGRKVATLVNEESSELNDFQFQENDLILFGSEKEGLDEEAIELMDASVYIPAIGHTPCLNVAVTFGIVMHQAFSSLKI